MHDVLSCKAVTDVCISTTRLQLTGFANSNLLQKLLPMVLNSCLEEKFARRSLITDHTFDTWASQYKTWTMYGATMKV